jgi:hypothetical protein
VPATPWRQATPPAPPRLRAAGNTVFVERGPAGGAEVATWAVWRRIDKVWHFAVLPSHERSVAVAGADAVVFAGVGRTGVLSELASLRMR